MTATGLPTEVELVFEVMPCNALRSEATPGKAPHPCTYFHAWGTYHSYDYPNDGPPVTHGMIQQTAYLGRARLLPELLSGCRKCPIMAIGINPNLPGWWSFNRGALNPLFDDYQQYAHYFRYRAIDKLALSPEDYAQYGGGTQDTPFSDFELNVPSGADGTRMIAAQLQHQAMYQAYQGLLTTLAGRMGWAQHRLAVGEDLAYGNMVACPSARWTTVPLPAEPDVPPMTIPQRTGIVTECFHKRKYFLRQLFQSLPAVLLVFGQSTANALIGEMADRFVSGHPKVGEPISKLMQRTIRLSYGDLPDGTSLQARVIFAPHITGNPEEFAPARARVVTQLVQEATAGHLRLNPATGHLARPAGACVFCPMLEIGPCDYSAELQPLMLAPTLTAEAPSGTMRAEKATQQALMNEFLQPTTPASQAWTQTDETAAGDPQREGLDG